MNNFIKPFNIFIALILSIGLFGCAGKSEPERRMAGIERALENVEKLRLAEDRIHLLCVIYDDAMSLSSTWPDSMEIESFLKEKEEVLEAIPERVGAMALEKKNIDAYKWAVERGVPVDLSYEGLKRYWSCGRYWQEFIADRHTEEALPVMMVFAVNHQNVRFFNQYAEAFKQSGNKIHSMTEVTSFNSAYCRFIAKQLKDASRQDDKKQITFLLNYMPRLQDVIHIDQMTKDLMRDFSGYVFNKLRDEDIACQLVELGYGFEPVKLEQTGFGNRFVETLMEHPEFAISEVCRLDQWHGRLSQIEKDFIMMLDEEFLGLITPRYLDETIEGAIARGMTGKVMDLMTSRSGIRPYRVFEYEDLFEQSIKYDDPELFAHILERCPEIEIENIDLVALSSNYDLFSAYAPQIFRKVYPTMDLNPRDDGTTLGRILDVLASPNHKASFWILDNVKPQDIWTEANEGRTLLMDVCQRGNLEVARYLIEKLGADVSAETGYMEMKLSILGQTESKEGRLTPIFFAAAGGNGELIRYLVTKGANVNARSAYGATPLMYAVTHNQPEAVRTLIALKANVNASMNTNIGRATSLFGRSFPQVATAYLRAKANGNQEIMKLLLQAGARP